MKNTVPAFILFFCLAVFKPVIAQSSISSPDNEAGLPYIQNFSPKDYGAGGQNWAIVQDLRGIMYFGNGAGVLEYDGVNWRIIPTANNSTVRSLAIDQNGQIFVGAQRDFGYLAADSTGQFQYVSLLDQVPPGYHDFADVYETLAIKNSVYFRTIKYIFRWQIDSSGSGTLKLWSSKTAFEFAFAIDDTIFVGQEKIGFCKLVADSLQLVPDYERIKSRFVMLMLPFKDKRDYQHNSKIDRSKQHSLVIKGTGDRFIYNGFVFKPFPETNLYIESEKFLKENRVFRGTVLPDGAFAIGTLRGGVAIIEQNGRLRQVLNREAGLRDEMILSVYADREGGLWVAMNNGLARVETPAPLLVYKEKLGVFANVEDFQRFNGQLYMATGQGIFVLSPSLNGEDFPEFRQVPGITLQAFSLISVWQTLLAATADGVFLINQNHASLIIKLYAFCLHHSQYNRNIVFVGLEQGLAVLQYVQEKWRFEGLVKDISEQVRTVVEESPGILWLGTRNRGYIQVDYRNVNFPGAKSENSPGDREEVFTVKIERFGEAQGVNEGSAYCYPVSGHTVFTTQKGLRRFDAHQQRFIPDSTFGPIFADTTRWIYPVAQGYNGNVWITSGIGSKNETRLAKLQEDGSYLLNPRLFARASQAGSTVNTIYPDPEQPGIVWFGMNEGAIRFNEAISKNYAVDFPALVRRIIVNGDSAIYYGTHPSIPSLEENTENFPPVAKKGLGWVNPSLEYQNNALRFEYAASSYDDPTQNQYQIFLNGFDHTWSTWTMETKKDYTNLPEGDYIFRVRAKNIYNHLSSEGKFVFTILPPWYRSWWSYVLYTGMFFGILIMFARHRERVIRKRTKVLEAAVQERTLTISEQAEKLKEMDKLKSRFFANISHEFRTPLTLIIGPLKQAEEKNKNKEIKKNLETAIRNARRLLKLINELLDLAKLESGKLVLELRPGNFSTFLKGVISIFSSMAEIRNINLQFIVNGEKYSEGLNSLKDAPLTYFDHDKMEKVFANLLANAFKFTPEYGKISVSVNIPHNISSASPPIKDEPQMLEIRVSDTGAGIPIEDLPHIFDRFYQARDEGDASQGRLGTGIGMALVKELVELHQGRIFVESEVGKGTIVIIYLPLDKDNLQAEEVAEIETGYSKQVIDLPFQEYPEKVEYEAETKNGISNIEQETSNIEVGKSNIKHSVSGIQHQSTDENATIILLVEDNPDMRTYIQDSFIESKYPDLPYQLVEAGNGREGFEKAVDTIPDLIISDVMMPEMNGYQLCEKLKTDERTSHIPVILLTAKAGEESKITGLETGADAYLTKPFNPRELQVRVKKLIEQRRRLRERFSKVTELKPGEIAVTSRDEAFIKRLIAIVEKYIEDETFDVSLLAAEAGLGGQRQLHRKLRALVNQTPSQFILILRLQRAAELIRKNAGTLAEIAYNTGFNTPNYFTKVFRKQFGCSPSEYRTKNK